MSAIELNSHDKAILNCVFNPHLPLEEAISGIEEELKGKHVIKHIFSVCILISYI